MLLGCIGSGTVQNAHPRRAFKILYSLPILVTKVRQILEFYHDILCIR